MKTLAVIPARLGATRLPRKPLRLLAGRPLVVRVWERVCAMDVAERCVIATDSEEVAAAAKANGADAVLTSSDHPSGTDRVAEVVGRREFGSFDAVVNVQGDEPFIAPAAVRGALDMLGKTFQIGTAAMRANPAILTEPSVVKVVTADDGRALYFSRAAIPHLREPKDSTDAELLRERTWQHIGVYAYTRDALSRWVALPPHPLERIERLEQLRPLAAGWAIGVAVISNAEPLRRGIDTETDLARANSEWTIFSGEPA
ncbi:MAG TPA: 3-deoxy-manno-octulosonate cytidylyltransferase [Gemmatimonadaceae bacterium]|nr:3-deoxy-manno-octulosonate cytidylyltransferase [Gemmatimonadaceae bacterium]